MAKRKRSGWGGRRRGAGRRDTDERLYGEPTVPVMVRLPRSLHDRIEGAPGKSLGRKIVAILQGSATIVVKPAGEPVAANTGKSPLRSVKLTAQTHFAGRRIVTAADRRAAENVERFGWKGGAK